MWIFFLINFLQKKEESRLSDRLRNHSAKIAVIGQGYVGLPLAVEFAKIGFHVTGIDLGLEKVAVLNHGESYIPDVEGRTIRCIDFTAEAIRTADAVSFSLTTRSLIVRWLSRWQILSWMHVMRPAALMSLVTGLSDYDDYECSER